MLGTRVKFRTVLNTVCETLAKERHFRTICPQTTFKKGPVGGKRGGVVDERHYLITGWHHGLTRTHIDSGVQSVLYNVVAGRNRFLGVPRDISVRLSALQRATYEFIAQDNMQVPTFDYSPLPSGSSSSSGSSGSGGGGSVSVWDGEKGQYTTVTSSEYEKQKQKEKQQEKQKEIQKETKKETFEKEQLQLKENFVTHILQRGLEYELKVLYHLMDVGMLEYAEATGGEGILIPPLSGHVVLTEDYKIVLASEMHWRGEESVELNKSSIKKKKSILSDSEDDDDEEEDKKLARKKKKCEAVSSSSSSDDDDDEVDQDPKDWSTDLHIHCFSDINRNNNNNNTSNKKQKTSSTKNKKRNRSGGGGGNEGTNPKKRKPDYKNLIQMFLAGVIESGKNILRVPHKGVDTYGDVTNNGEIKMGEHIFKT